MPNILLTSLCNRHCPYCFADEKISRTNSDTQTKKQQFISEEYFDRVLDFLEDSGEKTASFIGGEPTLHPKFEVIFEKALKRNFFIKIFSNGLYNEKIRTFLASIPPSSVKIICNTNPPQFNSDSEWSRVMETFKALGSRIILASTIWLKEQPLDYLLNLTIQYGLRNQIRIGIAQPIVGVENIYLPIEQYKCLAESLVEFARKCDEHNIKITFDCGLPLCMFTEEQLGVLQMCNAPAVFHCNPVLDIGTDLTVWSCFPLSKLHNVKLLDFKKLKELTIYFESRLAPYRSFGSFPLCTSCKYLIRNQCKGGCLAHTIRSFHQNRI